MYIKVRCDNEENGKRARGGILNISAIIATQPSHAVCQPPRGTATPVHSYSAIHLHTVQCKNLVNTVQEVSVLPSLLHVTKHSVTL